MALSGGADSTALLVACAERWPGQVSIGSAVSTPGDGDFVDLVVAADADMYRRRLERRG